MPPSFGAASSVASFAWSLDLSGSDTHKLRLTRFELHQVKTITVCAAALSNTQRC